MWPPGRSWRLSCESQNFWRPYRGCPQSRNLSVRWNHWDRTGSWDRHWAISGLCSPFWACKTIFCMCRISGIQFWQRRAQNDAAMRTRTHIKTLNSNFAPSSTFWACETIFRMYRISGFHFWCRRAQQNAALRTRTYSRHLLLTLLPVLHKETEMLPGYSRG